MWLWYVANVARFQDEGNAVENLADSLGGKGSDPFVQLCFVERNELCHIDNTLLRKIAFAWR